VAPVMGPLQFDNSFQGAAGTLTGTWASLNTLTGLAHTVSESTAALGTSYYQIMDKGNALFVAQYNGSLTTYAGTELLVSGGGTQYLYELPNNDNTTGAAVSSEERRV